MKPLAECFEEEEEEEREEEEAKREPLNKDTKVIKVSKGRETRKATGKRRGALKTKCLLQEGEEERQR